MRLYTKVVIPFVLAAVVLTWVITAQTRKAVRSVLRADLESPAREKGALVQDSMRVGLEPAHRQLLRPYLRGCLVGFGALYAAALDPAGRVLAHTDSSREGLFLIDPVLRGAMHSGLPASQDNLEDGRRVLNLLIPITAPGGRGRPLQGALVLGFSLEGPVGTEDRIAARVMLFSALSGGLALAVLLALLRGILKPIRELALGVQRISRGEYGTRVEVLTSDEVGDLAGRFNEMSRELASTTVSKERLTEVLASMVDAVFVVDDQGLVQVANPAALAMLGLPEGEIVGRPARGLLSAGDGPPFPDLEALRREGAVANAEARFLRRDGAEAAALVSGACLRMPDGRVWSFVFSAKDVTEMRRSAETLARTSERLRQAEKLSALGSLAAGIAHEINNPIGTIMGLAQTLLRARQGPAPIEEPLRVIEEEALRCQKLVRNMLAFTRRKESALEEFDLVETVDKTLDMVEAQARLRKIALVRDLGQAERIWGDRGEIQQVVVNLCANAMDAMPEGGTLTVRAGRAEREGAAAALLEVSDTGVGIPQDLRERIFQPFFTTKPPGQGTGLGLSLVREIVSRHQGAIRVESEQGRGASFSVTLPLRGPETGLPG